MSLTLVAISLTAMCGVGALAIDLGMLYKAHAEARVAAEAAALAGASVFLDPNPDSASAYDRAMQVAQQNSILKSPVTAADVDTFVFDLANERVGVKVVRPGIGTWFARVFPDTNLASVRIGAFARAGVIESSAAKCVTPIMIPDAWGDDTEDSATPWEDQIDNWTYGEPGDSYGPYNQPGPQTGYGSSYRNSYNDYTNDYGRPITLNPSVTGPGNFRLWTFQGENADIEERTTECDPRSVSLGGGSQYTVVQNENLPLTDLQDMIDDDPGTSWNTSGMQSTTYPDWRSSPRVLPIALYDPVQMQSTSTVSFNNIVLFFLESVDATTGSVSGRLVFYAPGNTDEGTPGTLVKHVKLVE
jgi:hypothetical protein